MAPVDSTSQRIVKLVVSPFLHFVCLGPAVVVALIVFSVTEYGGVLYRFAEPVFGQNDVVPGVDGIALATIFVFVALVSGSLSWALVLLEGLSRPKLIDHLRRCAYLYVSFVILSALQIPEYAKTYRLPGYPGPEFQTQVLWLSIVFAILVDALVLSGQRLRHRRAALEAGA